MSQTEFFSRHPTLLRSPSWLGRNVIEEHILPLDPGDYKVWPGERWRVTEVKSGAIVYDGIGPVEVTRSRAPF
jgi:hypothetical protein